MTTSAISSSSRVVDAYGASVVAVLVGSLVPTSWQGLAAGAALLLAWWLARHPAPGPRAPAAVAAMLSAAGLLALGAPRLSSALTAGWYLDDARPHHFGVAPLDGDGSVVLFALLGFGAFFLAAPVAWLAGVATGRWPGLTGRVTRGCALVAAGLGAVVVGRDLVLTASAPPVERWIDSLPVVATLPPLGEGRWETLPRSADHGHFEGDDRPLPVWKGPSDHVEVLDLSISRRAEFASTWQVSLLRRCGVRPCDDAYYWHHDRGLVVRHDAATGDLFLDDGESTRAIGHQDAVVRALAWLLGPHGVTRRYARDLEGRVRPSWPIALSHAAGLLGALVVLRHRRRCARLAAQIADAPEAHVAGSGEVTRRDGGEAAVAHASSDVPRGDVVLLTVPEGAGYRSAPVVTSRDVVPGRSAALLDDLRDQTLAADALAVVLVVLPVAPSLLTLAR